MKTIGFHGGTNLNELGNADDVESFFYCVKEFVNNENSDLTVISERLYKHYIALEDLDAALKIMDEIRLVFRNVESGTVNWDVLIGNGTRLNTKKTNLEEVYIRYFNNFIDVVNMAQLCQKEFGFYHAVKIVVTDTPEYMSYKKLSLEKYDAVVGKPLWQRE